MDILRNGKGISAHTASSMVTLILYTVEQVGHGWGKVPTLSIDDGKFY